MTPNPLQQQQQQQQQPVSLSALFPGGSQATGPSSMQQSPSRSNLLHSMSAGGPSGGAGNLPNFGAISSGGSGSGFSSSAGANYFSTSGGASQQSSRSSMFPFTMKAENDVMFSSSGTNRGRRQDIFSEASRLENRIRRALKCGNFYKNPILCQKCQTWFIFAGKSLLLNFREGPGPPTYPDGCVCK